MAECGRLPDLVIIGAPRSGTTSLYRYLAAHPEIYMAKGKEAHFFDRKFHDGLDRYRAAFAGRTERLAGEATPTYMFSDEAMARMADAMPSARLVALLRNPVDRAYSHYWLHRERGREDRSFREAIEAEADAGSEPGPGYLANGRYHAALTSVRRHFPASQLHILLFEDLTGEPHVTYASICRFLGARDDFVPTNLGQPVNRYVSFRSIALRRLTKRLHSPALRQTLGRVNTGGNRYPPMDADLRRSLVERFRQDNEALAALLGRDLSSWMQP